MTDIKKKVLAAVDGSEGALSAIRYAGQVLPAGSAEIVLLHVMPPAPPLYREATDALLQKTHAVWRRKQEKAAQEVLSAAESVAHQAGFRGPDARTKRQAAVIGVARDILVEGARGHYDAVIMGRRGLGLMEDLFIGSVSNKVLSHSRIPLWLVEGKHLARPVLVAVDGSEQSARSVDHAGFMLAASDLPITLFHVQPPLLLAPPPDPQVCSGEEALREFPFLAEAREELLGAGVPDYKIHVSACRRGRDPARELLQEVRQGGYGTIVLGRRGLSGAKGFLLGSVSTKLVFSARQMAVWVVP
jgi:nucleotide-binding universal stress UspA family protein